MQVKLKPILHDRIVHLRAQLAAANKLRSIETRTFTYLHDLGRGLTRSAALSAADVKTQLPRPRVDRPLQRPHDRCRDTRRMPIHSHHRPKTLEPEGIAQPPQHLRLPEFRQQYLGNGKP